MEVFEMIEVLSECDPGFELGWALGTISATGSSVRRDLRPRSNVLSDKSWQHDER